jgi:nucleotide-binding universal stress UspA family protein
MTKETHPMNALPKVLVATDFSESSNRAIESAGRFAKMMGAELIIVHVDPLPTPEQGEGMLYTGIEWEGRENLEYRLQALGSDIDGVNVEHQLLKGDPANEIIRAANERNVDLIVMSTHGRSGLARLLMGSVAEDVLRRAHCPVMMIKLRDADSDGSRRIPAEP